MENDISNDIIRIFSCGVELGAIQALILSGQLRPYLKKSEAFRQFGRKTVEKWIDQGIITPRKDGNHSAAWRIDRLEIESISKATDLIHYL